MHPDSFEFLKALAEAPSPSGYEQPVQKVFRDRVRIFADDVQTDVLGNCYGVLKGKEKPVVMLAGHCDEIGFMVKYIDDQGYLYFASIGGVDEQLLPGKRVWVHGQKQSIIGVVGRKPIHLLDPKDREKVPQIHTQFIDIGAKNRKEAAKHVRLGDPVTFAVGLENLLGDRVVSRAFDDKVGSFVVAEVLRMVGEKEAPFLHGLRSVHGSGGAGAPGGDDQRLSDPARYRHRHRSGPRQRLPGSGQEARRRI